MKTTLALAFTLAASAAFSQDVYTVDRVHSEVSFRVRHFVAKTPGRFDDFSGTITVVPGKPAESSVEFTIKAASINTANGSRDTHLKSADFFDVEKFPTIDFASSRIEKKTDGSYVAHGNLTMHGVTRSITFELTAKLTGGTFAANATIPITFTDYDIDDPSGAGGLGRDGEGLGRRTGLGMAAEDRQPDRRPADRCRREQGPAHPGRGECRGHRAH